MSELDNVSAWVGRRVRRTDDHEDSVLADAVVLAVDDTPWRPSAWIKYQRGEYPTYRSIDLCDLTDIATGEGGPAWGTPAAKPSQKGQKR